MGLKSYAQVRPCSGPGGRNVVQSARYRKKIAALNAAKIRGKIHRQRRSRAWACSVRLQLANLVVTRTSMRERKTSAVLIRTNASSRVRYGSFGTSESIVKR